jgi:hypothetical protein
MGRQRRPFWTLQPAWGLLALAWFVLVAFGKQRRPGCCERALHV